MIETIPSLCFRCGSYVHPEQGQVGIIDGELVMLCDSCKSISDSNNPGFSYQNQQNENAGVRIEGMVISKTENAGVVLACTE